MFQKKVTKSGSITIPSTLRCQIGIHAGTPVDVNEIENGIQITKHTATCQLCGNVEKIICWKGFELCKSCHMKMGEEFKNAK